MAAAIREEPKSAEWISEAGGVLLFGTIGSEAFLRPDGSVWYHEVVNWPSDPEKYEWREGRGNDRWAALVLGSKRMPELRKLLPQRPPNAPNCSACGGRGLIFPSPAEEARDRGVICADCGALGWIAHGAA